MIEIICGPMFSGKTEELIRRLKRVKITGKSYIVIKPDISSRYAGEETGISTHDETRVEKAVVAKCLPDVFYLGMDMDVVVIDEAQFFDKYLYFIVGLLADRGKRIIISGLDLDFQREPFPTMSKLMCIADRVDKLHAICTNCKRNAIFSYRTTEEKDLIVIGSKESYIPLCRKCFNSKLNGQ